MNNQKMYTKSPLPFIGQKRNWRKEIIEVAKTIPSRHIVLDLFGGSGIVSHFVKRARPDLEVIYNDYDNFYGRCQRVAQTNEILDHLRIMMLSTPRGRKASGETRERIKNYLSSLDDFDKITISAILSFSGKGLEEGELIPKTIYNKIPLNNYVVGDYFDGLTIVSKDYRELLKEYQGREDIFIFADPPYLNTLMGRVQYNDFDSIAWHLELLSLLADYPHVLFTSSKSETLEIIQSIKSLNLDKIKKCNYRNKLERETFLFARGVASSRELMLFS